MSNPEKSNKAQQQQQQNGAKSSATKTLIRMHKGVKYQYNYLKTVHSLQELNHFRVEHQCRFRTSWFAGKQKIFQMRCANQKSGCLFALLVWRTGLDKESQIHVYSNSNQHTNHHVISADEKLVQMRAMWSYDEEKPPRSFHTPNGRQWTYLETTNREKEFVSLLENIKDKYKCYYYKKKMVEKLHRTVCRATLYCTIAHSSNCKFQMLAHRTDEGRYHLYGSGAHTCKYKGKVTRKSLTKWREEENEQEQDEQQRALGEGHGERKKGGRQEEEEEEKNDDDEMEVQEIEEDEKKEGEKLEDEEMEQEEEVILQRKDEGSANDDDDDDDDDDDNEEQEEEDGPITLGKYAICWSDALPPAIFVTTVHGTKREWTFAETTTETTKEKAFTNLLMEYLRPKYHCRHQQMKKLEKLRCAYRCTLYCTAASKTGCKFALLVQRTDRGRYHIYTLGQHTCLHGKKGSPIPEEEDEPENAENVVKEVTFKIVLSDKYPPRSFVTQDGRDWSFVESLETKNNLLDQRDAIKRKYHCKYQALHETGTVHRATFFCTEKYRGGQDSRCRFAVLAQKTRREGRYHLYKSGEHTCKYKGKISMKPLAECTEEKEEDKELKWNYLMWSDEKEPPRSFANRNGCQWNYLKTAERGKELISLLDGLMRAYHCYYPLKKKVERQRRTVFRAMLNCTTSGGIDNYNCKFRLLAQRTDRGRYHFYTSGKHTCPYGRKVNSTLKSLHRDKWQEEDQEEEDDDIDDDDNAEKDEDEEQHENDEDDDDDSEKEFDQIAEGNDEEEEQGVDYEDDDDENEIPYGTEKEVQFVDFVDYPKSEGVKMRRLDEPKRESGANAVMIKLEEEVPTNVNQIIKLPKREVKEEAQEEDQPGPSNKGPNQQANIGTATATIKQQKQQPATMIARKRWWATPTVGHTATALNNEQRLLRERKSRINYRI